MESIPSDTWTESGQTPILREVSSSRVSGAYERTSRHAPDDPSGVATSPTHQHELERFRAFWECDAHPLAVVLKAVYKSL